MRTLRFILSLDQAKAGAKATVVLPTDSGPEEKVVIRQISPKDLQTLKAELTEILAGSDAEHPNS